MNIERTKRDIRVFKLLLDIDERPIEIEHLEEIGAKQKLFKDHIKTYEDIIESMKCCSNCGNETPLCCVGCKREEELNYNGTLDNWELKTK